MTEQENLELQIKTYDSNYRAGTPLCTDEVYDKLYEELVLKFPESSLLRKGVIEQKVSRKEKLPIPMYSLNKVKSIEEIKQWLKSNNISEKEILIITPKFDGISLVVDELKDFAWTRGDGEVGQRSGYHYIKMNDRRYGTKGFSFGEAIMSKSKFEQYKSEFANPRNMVAGLFNRDSAGEELKDVDYIRYGSDDNEDKINQIGRLNFLNSIECKYLILRTKEFFELDIETIRESLDELYRQWSEDYQIDGLVIDINSSELRRQLGREENMNPRYARAYKNPEWSGSAEVKVTGITWNVSKQGKQKPVIQIEPTEVAGVVISNVTGYNAAYIIDNKIAKGSVIKIIRSGDVIPKHIETLSSEDNEISSLMDEICLCSCCGTQTSWDETMTELICHNPECKEKKIAKLIHFFQTLEIEEFLILSLISLDLGTSNKELASPLFL